ncbi:hypothetical protein [Variovorax sp. N23]|uniref:hypothetical protein n=1 Tax=Variovorax sp. N23 TaxID=2980555 RepID=UPI0021C5731A|nr:hypothetical protein [Variovorax sp. N23]MCU4119741.1 hypothetical protein [Variovorax sp. N23]
MNSLELMLDFGVNMERWWKAGIVLCALHLLVACGEDRPSDRLASDTIRKIAERDARFGLEVADFSRENGWVDNQAPNRYTIRYNYSLRLTTPYPEIVLANAKKLLSEVELRKKQAVGGFLGMNALSNTLESVQQAANVNDWIESQGDDFKPRYLKMMENCAACVVYLNDNGLSKNEESVRFTTFFSSWEFFDELGFKDDAKIGNGIPRQAWSSFMKTEKGWLPS